MLFVQRADKSSVKRVVQLLASGSDAGKAGITTCDAYSAHPVPDHPVDAYTVSTPKGASPSKRRCQKLMHTSARFLASSGIMGPPP